MKGQELSMDAQRLLGSHGKLYRQSHLLLPCITFKVLNSPGTLDLVCYFSLAP